MEGRTGIVCPRCNEGEVIEQGKGVGAGREVVRHVCDTCGAVIPENEIRALQAEQ